eukprot:m.413240 g.413240  ORF g.413240 m.413240 type:complete len:448 (+) comp29046_c0_seq1:54-1397(+)
MNKDTHPRTTRNTRIIRSGRLCITTSASTVRTSTSTSVGRCSGCGGSCGRFSSAPRSLGALGLCVLSSLRCRGCSILCNCTSTGVATLVASCVGVLPSRGPFPGGLAFARCANIAALCRNSRTFGHLAIAFCACTAATSTSFVSSSIRRAITAAATATAANTSPATATTATASPWRTHGVCRWPPRWVGLATSDSIRTACLAPRLPGLNSCMRVCRGRVCRRGEAVSTTTAATAATPAATSTSTTSTSSTATPSPITATPTSSSTTTGSEAKAGKLLFDVPNLLCISHNLGELVHVHLHQHLSLVAVRATSHQQELDLLFTAVGNGSCHMDLRNLGHADNLVNVGSFLPNHIANNVAWHLERQLAIVHKTLGLSDAVFVLANDPKHGLCPLQHFDRHDAWNLLRGLNIGTLSTNGHPHVIEWHINLPNHPSLAPLELDIHLLLFVDG